MLNLVTANTAELEKEKWSAKIETLRVALESLRHMAYLAGNYDAKGVATGGLGQVKIAHEVLLEFSQAPKGQNFIFSDAYINESLKKAEELIERVKCMLGIDDPEVVPD